MTITVHIHARDMNVSHHLREHIERKISKLDKFLPTLTEARVDVAEAKTVRSALDRYTAQLTVHMRGVVLRAEERGDDIFGAVDAVSDKLERQIERYKGKRWQNRTSAGGPSASDAGAEAVLEEVAVDTDEPARVIARRKHFAMAPMNEAEALEQMALLGHDNFFVFYNADTSRINVLYRRKDGTFGLIEPEVA